MKHRRWIITIVALVIILVVITIMDRRLHLWLSDPTKNVERQDWYQMLRAVGYLPTWAFLSLGLIAHDRWRRSPAFLLRGVALFASAGLSGVAAELMKLIVGRERPIPHDGAFVFRPLFSAFTDGSNLGMPSSHAAVAFGGAFGLALLVRGTGPIALLAASGCAATRVLSGGHFVSDVFVAAVVAYAVSRVVTGPALRGPGTR